MDQDEAAFFSKPKRAVGQNIHTKRRKLDHTATDTSDTDSDSDKSHASANKLRRFSPKAQKASKVVQTNQCTNVIELSSGDEAASKTKLTNRRIGGRLAKQREDLAKAHHRRRSSSLTPPPQISADRLAAGTQFIKEKVFGQLSTGQSQVDIASTDIQIDESELLFEEQMRAIMNQDMTASPSKSLDCQLDFVKSPPTLAKSSSEDKLSSKIDIVIMGVYVEFKEHTTRLPNPERFEKPVRFRIFLGTKLSIAKISFCKSSGFCTEDGLVDKYWRSRMDQIILVYRNIRVFDNVTPFELGIAPSEQPFFEAHTKEGFTYLQTHPEERRKYRHTAPTDLSATAQASPQADATTEAAAAAAAAGAGLTSDANDQATNPGAALIDLHLRSQTGLALHVRAKPATRMSAIITGFTSKYADAVLGHRVRLFFEGEELLPESQVRDSELESGEQIDVRID